MYQFQGTLRGWVGCNVVWAQLAVALLPLSTWGPYRFSREKGVLSKITEEERKN